jgi:hypothetical protein
LGANRICPDSVLALKHGKQLLAPQVLAGELEKVRKRHHGVVADDGLRVGIGVVGPPIGDEPLLDLAVRPILVGDLDATE